METKRSERYSEIYLAGREAVEDALRAVLPPMTLRDYFAAAALTGLLADARDRPAADFARDAYLAADFMLMERERT